MPYIDHVNDIVRVVNAFKYPNGQFEEIGIHYQCVVAGGSDTRSALNGFNDTGVTVYLLAQLPTTAFFYGTECQVVKSIAKYGPKAQYNGAAGGSASSILPTQTRGLVGWKTQYAGRAYRGRTYLPTTTMAFLTVGGAPTAAALTAWNGWAGYMLGGVTSAGSSWIPGIYHRVPTAIISSIFDQFTGALVGPNFATQRRSGAYGRLNSAPF